MGANVSKGYRVEQLRPVPGDCSRLAWVVLPEAGSMIGWKAFDNCHAARKSHCLATRVVDQDHEMVDYYLDRNGSRDYGKEQHECLDCGGKYHATGSAHCPVANQDECDD
jgi:hypothetical protein